MYIHRSIAILSSLLLSSCGGGGDTSNADAAAVLQVQVAPTETIRQIVALEGNTFRLSIVVNSGAPQIFTLNNSGEDINVNITKEWVAGGALVVFVSVVVAFIYLQRYHTAGLKEAGHEAREQTDSIYASIAEISGIASSLRTLYRAQSDHEADYLDEYTEDLLEGSESIVSVGRVDRFKHADLDKFATLLSERGIYRFEVKSLNSDGTMKPSLPKETHDAIVGLYPFSPATARLVGVDLSYDDALATIIHGSAETSDLVFAHHPEGFPKSGDSLLFIPTYAGRYTPDSNASRLVQFDGGFVLELSYDNLLMASDRVSSVISLPGITLRSKASTVGVPKYFQRIFRGHETLITPSIGNSEISVKIHSMDGVPVHAIVKSLMCVAVWLLFCFITIGLGAKNRKHEFDRRASKEALELERKIALVTLEAINDSIFTVGSDGNISYVNPAAEAMVSKDADALLGSSLATAIPFSKTGSDTSCVSSIKEKIGLGKPTTLNDIELDTTKVLQVDCTYTPFVEGCSNDGGVLVMRDVGAERALTQKLEHLATHDSLTGLVNRYYFELKLQEAIDGANDKGEIHAICYIDLDQFKTINDTCGHAAGDRLIKQMSANLKERCRHGDVLARLGGDEFGLLIRNSSDIEAESIARDFYESLQNYYFTSGEHKFAVRACFGFVSIDDSYGTMAEVLSAADIACYSAKDRGRNEMHVFKPECEETTQRHGEMLMLPVLQNALALDKFTLFVQPIAEILDNGYDSSKKYEILLRMIGDDGSLITPYQLICAAERYDLMKQVDRWVINRSFIEIASLVSVYGQSLPMFSINLSGQSIMDAELVEYIRCKFDETGVPKDHLCFEITETSAMVDTKLALELLEFLHDQGCKVALDDFGAGECSFGYLKTLPVDYLKVDGQFVKDVATCEVHKEMLRFVQRVAELLDMKTVAEFVESESIVDTLREMNIDYAQGYYIGKPFSISELKTQNELREAA